MQADREIVFAFVDGYDLVGNVQIETDVFKGLGERFESGSEPAVRKGRDNRHADSVAAIREPVVRARQRSQHAFRCCQISKAIAGQFEAAMVSMDQACIETGFESRYALADSTL